MTATPELRRLAAALASSGALHVLAVLLVLGLSRPLDTGFEFTAPIEVSLGMTDATEAAQAPPAAPPPEEPPPAPAGSGEGTPAGEGLDAGVPSDGGLEAGRPDAGRRRRRDAGVDGGDLVASAGGGDAGAPVAFLPPGAQIALRIDMDRVRASPLRPQVERLLSAIPDWDAVLGGSGIDPVRDLSRVLIATPNFLRSNIVVAGALTPEAPAPREVAERVAEANGHTLAWDDEDGVPSAPFYSPDGADRRVAILDERHVVLCRPDDLPRVLAIAAARVHDDETSPADALLSMGENEALSLEAEGLAAFVRRSPCEVARRARVAMIETHDGVDIVGNAYFDTAEHASSARECFDDLRNRAAANPLVQIMGFSVPLYEIEMEATDETLHVEGALTFDQLRRILEMLEGMLRRPPPPPPPVLTPPVTDFPNEPAPSAPPPSAPPTP